MNNSDNSNIAYFFIKINFYQNNTFQGEIEWLNRGERNIKYFRSFLEMILLISEAIEQLGHTEVSRNLRSWQTKEE